MDDATTTKRKRPVIRFNDLPTDILIGIISRLPIKEAARTSILSSHWKKIWCSHVNLEFSFYSMSPRLASTSHDARLRMKMFIERVSQVFAQHSGLSVQKIAIQGKLDNEHADHINRWLSFVSATKTKDLTFDFKSRYPREGPYDFPFKFFGAMDSSYLLSMRLSAVSLNPPVDFKAFLNLKRLKLEHTNITDENMQILISNCNALEFLGIVDCGKLTRLSTSHLWNQLKHLHVESCHLLKEIELNLGLTKLGYKGTLIPLSPPGPLLLTNVCMKLQHARSSLGYIFTNLPSTLLHLETLSLQCSELERAILPENHIKFMYLKHLRLQLRHPVTEKKIDLLDFACLLEAAPLLQKFELHMWMPLHHQRYREEAHGELRSLPPQPHAHLRLVHISGFIGMKDQLELSLHILRNSAMIRAMKVDPKPLFALPCISMLSPLEGFQYLDGYEVAIEYLCREDHNNVVDVSEIRREEVETLSVCELVYPDCVRLTRKANSSS
ncbi:F-box/FBD/LRR-repeat protein At1g13570 [Oryza sativa Japonica Group]|uniref:Os07g0158900 protein n=8 Tax=Oryza TaxID=4527 RepID=Q0D8H8_ORYSJ|nr:F-box/FBD/LRR-repeat protein At1g13570 [Oryza sativa Japonica Group]XP_015647408.1 F-box/FBD/LRR-repeat protein At1g13570 [Oryza sativa Japonica Group]XP_015647409.1 F-box/FBD/LRR-repeat protein At1g13570 [Oryza sativa Japonica Group]XP_015647410.1 F-box/FBD/LRR-repeat protein At1g13570 [Oryza sativa Japonica Group]XP_052162811.1 F-box/FBD/LRR-repeat protein At1g13570-like [Oryza glaberrima]XP_052162812.1 F-box/FBD/LRR-repeat protein At1g13570-like [Oryza glaberrima]XP_052162813.1 F-box/FB|eukprot:NP_001058931.1 Os07g0158900 [Oryza sativa Japonica Group]